MRDRIEGGWLYGGAGPVIVASIAVLALYAGQALLMPLAMGTLLAFVLAPIVQVFERARLPRAAAVVLAVLIAFLLLGGLGFLVSRQAGALVAAWPRYEAGILARWHMVQGIGWLRPVLGGVGLGPAPAAGGGSMLATVGSFARPVLAPLADAGLVIVFALFVLLYSEDLRDRFVRLAGRSDLHRTILALNEAGRRLSRFFLMQSAINAGFGLWIGLGLGLVGVPGGILWGILAGLMRFVPFIGTYIALAPPLLMALATSAGWTTPLLVVGFYLISELFAGQVIEPLTYGHSTGISPVAVVVSAMFWALLWGTVGLLLATPLTVLLVVMGRHLEPLTPLDILLGDRPPLLPAETFYQRALEGRSATLLRAARRQITASSLADYYDRVALPGLLLAQHDRAREADALAFERLEGVHAQVAALLPGLGRGQRRQGTAPAAWAMGGAVLCLPARGQLDDLAAEMTAQALAQAGFGALAAPNAVLDGERPADAPAPRLVCFSMLEDGTSVAGIRYFVRRAARQFPGAAIVIGLWQAMADSEVLAQLRAEGRHEHIVLSLGELLALARALAHSGGERPAAARAA